MLLESLLNFYKINPIYKDLLVKIVKQQPAISLRALDWTFTRYSKKYGVHYNLEKEEQKSEYIPSNKNFNLWLEYKNQLKAYSKRMFDPFCRRQRIFFNTKLNLLDQKRG